VSSRINVGLIGAGRIGRLNAEHLAFRIPGANLVAVSDIVLEAAQKCAAAFGIPTATRNHRAIMKNPDIEAIVIGCASFFCVKKGW